MEQPVHNFHEYGKVFRNLDTFNTTVFEVASGKWPDIMATIDREELVCSFQTHTQCVRVVLPCPVYDCICNVNVFIGVIIEKYNENKDASEGSGLLTTNRRYGWKQ